ncbi:unnamed protein product, partial [Allacma fusca]
EIRSVTAGIGSGGRSGNKY